MAARPVTSISSVAGHLALLDQFHHGQKSLPVFDQDTGQFLLVYFHRLPMVR
jgi:hypothetical protein